jgi:hypothetical protein
MSTTIAGPISRSWRRFPRFSVRGLIVIVLLIGAGLGWLVRADRMERETVAVILHAGGWIEHDGEEITPNTMPGGPIFTVGRLEDLVRGEVFDHYTSVSAPKATDATLLAIGRLTRLDALFASDSAITDAGLARLGGLHLSILRLHDTQVTDAGLIYLKGMRGLSQLDLGHTEISDAALAHLSGKTGLTHLHLRATRITDAAVAQLIRLKNLAYLDLGETQVTDAAVMQLNGLTRLEILGLSETNVTDIGLARLKLLSNLSSLDLRGTQVTDAGVKELQQVLPSLKITR